MDVCALLKLLKESVKKFYDEDENLLFLKGWFRPGMEQACAFRIGHYLCNKIEGTEFRSYNIDMEYNKNLLRKKISKGYKNGLRPDLIVHNRGRTNKNNHDIHNLLIVEFKYNSNTENDAKKLEVFTTPHDDYRYQLGVSVNLGKKYKDVEYRYFQKGEEITESMETAPLFV